MFKITNIHFKLVYKRNEEADGTLVAYTNFIIDDIFWIGSIRIIKDSKQSFGYKLVYPKTGTLCGYGPQRKCFLPVNFEAENILAETIIKEFILQHNELKKRKENFEEWLKHSFKI